MLPINIFCTGNSFPASHPSHVICIRLVILCYQLMYCKHLIYVACIYLNPNRTYTPMILMCTGMILLDLTLQNDWSKRLLCIQLRYVIIEVHVKVETLPPLENQ